MMTLTKIIERKKLYYGVGSSDKVYELFIEEHDEPYQNHYRVTAHYGRRGSRLNRDVKKSFCTLDEAQNLFGKLITAKQKKGYQEY